MRKLALTAYLAAGLAVTLMFAAELFGPSPATTGRILERLPVRVLLGICLVIVLIHLALTLVRLLRDRREPDFLRLAGNGDIQVSAEAVCSCARIAAAADPDVMVEDVRARVTGAAQDGVHVRVTAVSFLDSGLEGLAFRLQGRVTDACERMLGVPGVTVQVRFLPSKTEIVHKGDAR